MSAQSSVYVGIKGHVVALDRATGAERWRTKLKGASFVALHRDDRYLYAIAQGQLFCLDPASGAVVWRNELKGLGFGLASVLSDAPAAQAHAESSTGHVTVAEELRRRAAHAAG